MTPVIEDDGLSIDVSKVPDVELLLTFMREVNTQLPSPEERGGKVWFIRNLSKDSGSYLLAGVRGERGSLNWSTDKNSYIPRDGLNDQYADYYTTEGYELPQDPGSEVPIAVVFKAVEQFFHTNTRPTCVQWIAQPASPPSSVDVNVDPWA